MCYKKSGLTLKNHLSSSNAYIEKMGTTFFKQLWAHPIVHYFRTLKFLHSQAKVLACTHHDNIHYDADEKSGKARVHILKLYTEGEKMNPDFKFVLPYGDNVKTASYKNDVHSAVVLLVHCLAKTNRMEKTLMKVMIEMKNETRMKSILEAINMKVLSGDNMDRPLEDVIFHYARG